MVHPFINGHIQRLADLARSEGQLDLAAVSEHVGYLLLMWKNFPRLWKAKYMEAQLGNDIHKNLMNDMARSWDEIPFEKWARSYLRVPEFTTQDFSYLRSLFRWVNDMPPEIHAGELFSEVLRYVSGWSYLSTTHEAVVDTMVALVRPGSMDTILDPAASTANMLVATARYMAAQGHGGARLTGYDVSRVSARLGTLNLLLNQVEGASYQVMDALSDDYEATPVNVILTNPPFGNQVDQSRIHPRFGTASARSELLFLELGLFMLKPGGRCAMLVPEHLLFSSAAAHRTAREKLLLNASVEAVISLPLSGTEPAMNVKTSILFFTKSSRTTEKVWFYDVPGGRKADLAEELEKALEAFQRRTVSEYSWEAGMNELSARDFALATSLYRPQTAVDEEVEDPREVVARIRVLEKEFTHRLNRLEKLLPRANHG